MTFSRVGSAIRKWLASRSDSSAAAPDEMPFFDHLEEMRWRILWALLAIALCTGAGFLLVTHFDVLGLLIKPIEPHLAGEQLKYLSPTVPFFITLKLALVAGLILSSPVVVYQFWVFISPALMPREKRAIIPALMLGLVLFCSGVALAYFAALPITLEFMMSFQVESLQQNITISGYLPFVIKLLLAFGLVFELPVVILVLAVLGIVDSDMLRSKRRYAIVISAIVASIITPGDLIVLTAFMILPLVMLYELSIALTRLVERRRKDPAAEDEALADHWLPQP